MSASDDLLNFFVLVRQTDGTGLRFSAERRALKAFGPYTRAEADGIAERISSLKGEGLSAEVIDTSQATSDPEPWIDELRGSFTWRHRFDGNASSVT